MHLARYHYNNRISENWVGGWVGHAAFRRKKKNTCRVFMRKLEGDNLEVLYVDGKILQWILKMQGQMTWT
jgi:hypothetical protein